MTIKLRVPAVADEADPEVELRPVYVEEWVDALPFADPVKLLADLHGAVARMNRSPVKPAVRLGLMELYLRPYQFLLELAENHGAVHSISAFERNRAETDATRRVAVELGYGYKHVAADSLAQRGRWGGSKQLARALQRSALCLAHTLLHSYHEYLPTPKHLWTELAEVYAYASSQDLHDAPNPSGSLREDFAVPVAGIYKRILLVGLVDPHHLAYGEIWAVARAIAACADAAEIAPYGTVEKPAGVFVLDSRRDRIPEPHEGRERENGKRLGLLNTRPAIKALHVRATELKGGAKSQARRDEAALVARIVNALGRPPKRRDERVPSEGQVSFATGLATVHHFLGGSSTDAGGAGPSRGAGEDEDVVGDANVGESTDFGRHSYMAEYWQVMNRGRGGIGVLRHIRPNRSLGVGELVGVQFDGKLEVGVPWSVGVVRWLNVENAGEYQAGIELLAPSAMPAIAIVEAPDDESPTRTSAVLVETPGGDGNGSVILPHGAYVEGRVLLIESRERSFRIRCSGLAETNAGFDLGRYEPV